ncbi:acetoin utilization deacetylase AcuC-like enzyme [Silvimonas terrae]|uniref:Acetoin utilization deacetylase AcuC-like enzyme n=1 Tax=Silvimonas terrae TaxID=300266 RepID=A0A840RC38_9NEIS|nr:histone deacetylase [Silvimonas terrae]MBB5189996.1 acetoin utilization deacetylase AcuC-like enzyme [Silvimonas terrae]
MLIFRTDQYPLPLPVGHRFPASKYALLHAAVQPFAAHLIEDAPAASDYELLLAHTPDYLTKLIHGTLSVAEQRVIGLPWSAALLARSRRSTGATLAACRTALLQGCGVNLAGGTHHACADHGSGFCVFNDSAVALRVLQAEGAIRRALVIDLDVHQGNGTAVMLADDPNLFTLSIHGANNFPFSKVASDLDIELPDGTTDARYLHALETTLPALLRAQRPDLVIYLAGADAWEGDRLGRLALTPAGLQRRDELVLSLCQQADIPVAVTMGGGYGRDIGGTVAIHAATVNTAVMLFDRMAI